MAQRLRAHAVLAEDPGSGSRESGVFFWIPWALAYMCHTRIQVGTGKDIFLNLKMKIVKK